MGLKHNSYEAYCLDEAVILFGLTLEAELEEASAGKPSKEAKKAEAARKRILNRVLGDKNENAGSGFADPAAMFK